MAAVKTMETENFALPDRFDIGRLKQDLRQRFHRIEEHRRACALELFDTFDWRLFASGRLLAREESALILFDARSGRELMTAAVSRRNRPRFWWELPESPLRTVLQEALDVRALMMLIKLEKRITTLHLLDKEEKTVVRVAFESAVAAEKKTSDAHLQSCRLLPVRGYRRQFKAAREILSSAGVTGEAENLLIAALEGSGLQPGGYSSKTDIALEPGMPAGEAARRILAHLVGIMRANEDGIRKDIDSEFLHDFRVAIRRARSLMTLLKGVFDPAVERALKEDLQAAGKATNRLRDLDVYLLDQQSYEERIPDRLHPGIAPLFTSLKRRRSAERKKTVRFLDSADYRRIVEHIEEVSGSAPQPETDEATQPIQPLASRVIFRRYRKIIKAGGRVDHTSPDDDLHRLRIECKKLRYALEFFRTLYPLEEMKDLIKQLKSLQDNLGRFNDLSVQQDFLRAFLETIDGRKPSAVELAAATGALITRLQLEHRQVREAFVGVFSKFNSEVNRKRYERLFAKQGSPS
jgi:CHAD domain-containing protein